MNRFVLLCACFTASAQPKLAFEVVSIKPAPQPTPDLIRSGYRPSLNIDAARVHINGYALLTLISSAFKVQPAQVEAPDFARSEYFEVQATLPEGATREQVPEMLVGMLEERFKLAYHREPRDYPMNVLTVGKSGVKLPRLPDGTPASFKTENLPNGGMRQVMTGKITALFPVMNSFGGLQLVDATGLDGIYTWVQEIPSPSPDLTYQEALQDSFKAMIEAAGLKLETRKVPKETIVVDRLEKAATAN